MTNVSKIRALNDDFRKHFRGGSALITPGVAALGSEAVQRIVATIAIYNDFCKERNDPHLEHDFGSFEDNGQTVFFKIDYYNLGLDGGSPDPADPTVTSRVMTVMLAEEY